MTENNEESVKTKDAAEKQIKRYVLIELSCDVSSCSPCTYPDCQRYRRNVSLFGSAEKRPKINKITELEKDGSIKA